MNRKDYIKPAAQVLGIIFGVIIGCVVGAIGVYTLGVYAGAVR